MGAVLGHLKPALVWNHFEEITKYPRPSKKEEKIASYLLEFAKRKKLEVARDKAGNILIKKPATPGRERLKTVVLQSHIDMVCEKNRDVEHDFDNDPIQAYIDGDWVKAKGTTLGADNGIGVAAALAVLESEDLLHGPIECLFTIDEETGLTGAQSLKKGFLKGEILLNLDSEEEGSLYIGCSGGKNTSAAFTYKKAKLPNNYKAFELKVAGLLGGHSGLEIHAGRGNAIKILTRLLMASVKDFNLKLASIEGGNKTNAIPREAFACVMVPSAKASKFKAAVARYNKMVKAELATPEPGLQVSAVACAKPKFVLDERTVADLLNALYGCPHGVIKMSAEIPGLVETSTNLATIATNDKAVVVFTSQRSSVASEIFDVIEMVASVFRLAGAELTFYDGYPGWQPNINSEILKLMEKNYKELFSKEPEVKAIHAGLECGIIGEKYPAMDMISFGPTMFGVHSPDERLNIPSVLPFWQLIVKTLASIPAKQ